jgi:hypothetical protein
MLLDQAADDAQLELLDPLDLCRRRRIALSKRSVSKNDPGDEP